MLAGKGRLHVLPVDGNLEGAGEEPLPVLGLAAEAVDMAVSQPIAQAAKGRLLCLFEHLPLGPLLPVQVTPFGLLLRLQLGPTFPDEGTPRGDHRIALLLLQGREVCLSRMRCS